MYKWIKVLVEQSWEIDDNPRSFRFFNSSSGTNRDHKQVNTKTIIHGMKKKGQ